MLKTDAAHEVQFSIAGTSRGTRTFYATSSLTLNQANTAQDRIVLAAILAGLKLT